MQHIARAQPDCPRLEKRRLILTYISLVELCRAVTEIRQHLSFHILSYPPSIFPCCHWLGGCTAKNPALHSLPWRLSSQNTDLYCLQGRRRLHHPGWGHNIVTSLFLPCASRQHTCRWPWLSSVLLPPFPTPPADLASGAASWPPFPSPPHASGVSCSQLLAFPTLPSLNYCRIPDKIWEPRIKHSRLRNTLHMYIYCCKMFCMALTSRFSQTVCAHWVFPHPSCQ